MMKDTQGDWVYEEGEMLKDTIHTINVVVATAAAAVTDDDDDHNHNTNNTCRGPN